MEERSLNNISFGTKLKKFPQLTILIAFIAVYVVMFIWFLCYYFGVYGKENTNLSFNNEAVVVTEYIEKTEKFDGKKVNFRVRAIQPYIYTLIGSKTSPQEFKETAVIDRGAVWSYGRYIFYNNEINDDTIYVLDRDETSKEILLNKGFKLEEFNENIDILYKD